MLKHIQYCLITLCCYIVKDAEFKIVLNVHIIKIIVFNVVKAITDCLIVTHKLIFVINAQIYVKNVTLKMKLFNQ